MVNKWEIYYCDLEPTKGSEQKGRRPVLVISNDGVNHNLSISTVLPISSIKPDMKIYPTEVELDMTHTNLPKPSIAMIQQIRTISQNRLTKKIGQIDDIDLQNRILDNIKMYFEY